MTSFQKISNVIRRLENNSAENSDNLSAEAALLLRVLSKQIKELTEKVAATETKDWQPKRTPRTTKRKRKRKKAPKFPEGTPIMERILAMVDKQKDTGCWNWMGYGSDQYGYIRIEKRTWLVHRLMVTLRDGKELHTNDHVMHKCDNTWCCNPDHLEVGSAKENRKDCIAKGRQGRGVGLSTAKEIRIRYLKGETSKALSLAYGIPQSSIKNIVIGNSFKSLSNDPDVLAIATKTRGFRMSVLTEGCVREIRDMLAQGISQAAIAEKFSVSPSTINGIKSGRRWSHIS